jgi:iron complex transport system substrate-binding protein
MSKRIIPLIHTIIAIVLLSSACMKRNTTGNDLARGITSASDTLQYAKGFSIQSLAGSTRITVYNPWQGANNISYRYLVSSIKPQASELVNAIWIKKPVRRIICLSTTQIGMIEFVNELETIVGISGVQYVCNPELEKYIKEGKVKDVGYDISLNYELIYSLKPDVILIYGVNSEASSLYDRMKSYGIPALFIGEYLEPDPLAKAEWVKLIACLFDKESLVKSEYSKMAANYIGLKNLIVKTVNQPVVMTGLPWKEAWNIPGGDSFTARLISDAGGKYVWAERKTRDNIPMNLEQAVNDAKNTDIWINTGTARAIADIRSTDERLIRLRPVLKMQVYNNNKSIGSGGGNDYWERGVVHPELILQDLIMIFHPELNLNKEFTYYRKLE